MPKREKTVIRFRVDGRMFEASAGKGVPDWPEHFEGPHYKFVIRIRNLEGEQKTLVVPFWGSIADYKEGKDTLSPEDLAEAVAMIFRDAQCFWLYEGIDELARELCIDKPSEAIRVWRAVRNLADRMLEKWGFRAEQIDEAIHVLEEDKEYTIG